MVSNQNMSSSKVIQGETGGYFNKSIKNDIYTEPSISRIPEEMHDKSGIEQEPQKTQAVVNETPVANLIEGNIKYDYLDPTNKGPATLITQNSGAEGGKGASSHKDSEQID